MTVLEKIEKEYRERKDLEKRRTYLRERLRGIYAYIAIDREFSEEDKCSIFNEIRSIVRDKDF